MMQQSKPSVWAGLFSAAMITLSALSVPVSAAVTPPSINGTYAAVTPQSVELLTLRTVSGEVRGSYRVLHLDASQAAGIADQGTKLSSITLSGERSFALEDTRNMTLRFDSKFQHAAATSPALTGTTQTQSFARVSAEQAAMLVDMARYGGLFVLCQAHHDSSCAGLHSRLSDLVPFRPFPQTAAHNPVLGYVLTTRLDHSLALNP